MRLVIQGLVAAAVIAAITFQYEADAALNAGLQLPLPQIDPSGLTLLKPDRIAPEEFSHFYPYGDVFAALPPAREAAPNAAPSDDVPATTKLSDAPATPDAAPRNDLLGNIDPADMRPDGRASEAALVPETPAPATRRQSVPEAQLRESIPAFEVPEGNRDTVPEAKQRKIETEKGSAPSRKLSARAAKAPTHRPARIEFGTPTLPPMAHTRFCLKYPAECQVHKVVFRGGAVELTPERRAELTRINADVNRAIEPERVNETVAGENWLISPKAGDCNDYAVTKRHELLARGWPARSLLLAEVVVPWGEHHLVLVIRTQDGDLVVDNLNKNIRAWTKTGYQWVRVQSAANPTFWSSVKAQPDMVAMVSQAARL